MIEILCISNENKPCVEGAIRGVERDPNVNINVMREVLLLS